MARTVVAERLIRVAPGTVWKTWGALVRWPRWQPETEEAGWIGAERWVEGSTFSLLRRTPYPLLGRLPGAAARRFVGQVMSVVDESLLLWELRPTRAGWFGPVLVESVRLDPAPSGTTVTVSLTAHGLGPSLLGPLMGGPLAAQLDALLDGLHHELAPVERRR